MFNTRLWLGIALGIVVCMLWPSVPDQARLWLHNTAASIARATGEPAEEEPLTDWRNNER